MINKKTNQKIRTKKEVKNDEGKRHKKKKLEKKNSVKESVETKSINSEMLVPVPPEKRTEAYWETLNRVIDPEIGLGIVDLGLIYQVAIKNGVANIIMTLTSPACPSGPEILEQIQEEMLNVEGVERTEISLVWEPAWSPERIDTDLRQMLFGL